MPMKNDDRTLAQRAGRGDQEAFAQLVERYTGLVYSLAMQRVGNHHDAEDVAQTVFLKAWKALPGFRGDAAFSTWLYRMTANAATDLLRQRGRRETPVPGRSRSAPDRPSGTGSRRAGPGGGAAGGPGRRRRRPAGAGPGHPPSAGAGGPVLRGDRRGAGPSHGDGPVQTGPGQEGPGENFAGPGELMGRNSV